MEISRAADRQKVQEARLGCCAGAFGLGFLGLSFWVVGYGLTAYMYHLGFCIQALDAVLHYLVDQGIQ